MVEGARPTRQRTDDGTRYTVPARAAPGAAAGPEPQRGLLYGAERGRSESREPGQG